MALKLDRPISCKNPPRPCPGLNNPPKTQPRPEPKWQKRKSGKAETLKSRHRPNPASEPGARGWLAQALSRGLCSSSAHPPSGYPLDSPTRRARGCRHLRAVALRSYFRPGRLMATRSRQAAGRLARMAVTPDCNFAISPTEFHTISKSTR